MIEIIKERSLFSKDIKDKIKNTINTFELTKISKFTSAIYSSRNSDSSLTLFLGFSNGNVMKLSISREKNLFYKYEEAFIFPCKEEFKHKGNVNCMINEIIDGYSMLFTGGIDNYIKIWNTEVDDPKIPYYTKTLFGHKGAIISLGYCKTKSLLFSSSIDKTLRIWKMDDNFVKVMNPVFNLFQVLKFTDKYKQIDEPFWVTSFTIKEQKNIKLYAADTQGGIHYYKYLDLDKKDERKYDERKSEFIFKRMKKYHSNACIQVIHSLFDPIIYSLSFDTHLIGYNFKTNTKSIDVSTNSKQYFTCISFNYTLQEILCGDDKGNLTFIKIFNKAQMKLKAVSSKIFYVHYIELFKGQEHLVVISEESIDIFRIKREMKVQKEHYHDDQVIKLFVIEPVKKDNIIIEDTKIISASYDNKVKIWDFLSMECICLIDLAENKHIQKINKNVEISTVCYLSDSKLIAIGLDIGLVLFWDMSTADYINNLDYHKYYKHKSNITSIIHSYLSKYEKEKNYLFSAGYDGLILIWHIEAIEMKLSKLNKENENNITKGNLVSESSVIPIISEENKNDLKKDKPNKNYKYLPNVKICMNTLNQIKGNSDLKKKEIFCLCFMTDKELLYSGGNDSFIHIWNVETATYVDSLKGHKEAVTCLTYDMHFLFSGSADSVINIWNTLDNTLVNRIAIGETLSNIIDLVMIPKYGFLVSISNNKTVNFLVYEKGSIMKTITTKEDLCCSTLVNSYGKILCGTKQKTIIELDLAEILDSLSYSHKYTKFPFINEKSNYTAADKIDKKINNFQVMNLITKDLFDG